MRFIIRQRSYGYRIIEVVSKGSRFGTLTIEWDGIHSCIETAVARIEIELRLKLKQIKTNEFGVSL
jgi:hypothetical protein